MQTLNSSRLKSGIAIPTQTLIRPKWLPKDLWPFETYGLEVEGSVLAVTEVGEGPVLLMAHVGMWSFVWRDLMTLLSRDFRCICFDAPGNGRTLDAPASAVSLEGVSRALYGLVERLELNDFTLVVHDLAGPASIAALGRMPQRVRGLVAMNAFAWRPADRALRFMLALMGSGLMREINVRMGFLQRITASNFGVGRHMDERSRAAFFIGIGPRGRKTFHEYMHDARTCDALYAEAEAALRGPVAKVPLISIFGERNDPFHFQEHWKELFPKATQVVVAGGNHFPMCDAPQFVADTILAWHREIE
jgi:pimeloyl-ACP methyl ester carboxylesterase